MELESLYFLLNGLINCFTPYNFLMILIGITVGIIGGMLPGISPVTAIALFTPFTFTMPADSALISLGAVFTGSTYGGANASILINTPGTPASVATTFDGYPMTKNGKAEEALYGALWASAYGGAFGGIALLLFFKPLCSIGLKFGSESFFWLAIFGLTTLVSMFPGNLFKGILGCLLGLAASTFGLDKVAGIPRFTFDYYPLTMGFDMVVLLIALFSICQMLLLLEDKKAYIAEFVHHPGAFWRAFHGMVRSSKVMLMSSAIGTFIGVLPGAGGNVASIVAYNEAKRWDKTPERFGTGELDGVLAAESSNNACVGGALVPLLSLGIPGSAAAATLMAGLLAQGLQPGPQMLERSPDVAYTFIISLIVVCFVIIPVGYSIARLSVRIIDIPKMFIIPSVITLSFIGTFSLRNSLFDVLVMMAAGIIAYILAKAKIPTSGIALGVVLGQIIEENLNITLIRSRGYDSVSDLLLFSPMAFILILCNIAVLALPFYFEWRKNRRFGVTHEKKSRSFSALNIRRLDFRVIVVIGLTSLFFVNKSREIGGVSGLYPLYIFGLAAAVSLIICVSTLFTPLSADHQVEHRETLPANACVCAGISFLGYFLIPLAGFYTTMFLIMMGILLYLRKDIFERLTVKCLMIFASVSILVVLLEYLCFTLLLHVDTPAGYLW